MVEDAHFSTRPLVFFKSVQAVDPLLAALSTRSRGAEEEVEVGRALRAVSVGGSGPARVYPHTVAALCHREPVIPGDSGSKCPC